MSHAQKLLADLALMCGMWQPVDWAQLLLISKIPPAELNQYMVDLALEAFEAREVLPK